MGETTIVGAAQRCRRILVVDDAPQVLDAVSQFLGMQDFLEVVGTARDGREAIEKTATLRPDVVLMDWHMPEMDGLKATTVIRRAHPRVQVVIMTMDDNQEVRRAVERHGAHGFVSKSDLYRDLVPEIRRVLTASRPPNSEEEQ